MAGFSPPRLETAADPEPAQASVQDAVGRVKGTPHSTVRVLPPEMVTTGAVVSTTLTVRVAVAVLLLLSVAV